MTVGDKGTAIVVYGGGFYLAGTTCRLLGAPGVCPNQAGNALTLPPFPGPPMTISLDGLSAIYTTTGYDFLVDGPWQLQFQVETAIGQKFTSPPGVIYVYPLLKAA